MSPAVEQPNAVIVPFPSGDLRSSFLARAEAPGAARILRAYAVFGLFCMLVPGTLVGVLNLLTIGGQHAASAVAPAWVQSHGHAQIFGWIGTFIIGIGYYSLPASRRAKIAGVDEAWIALSLWGAGVLIRWSLGISEAAWHALLPISAALEFAGFLLFFRASAGHRPEGGGPPRLDAWALLVVAATAGMLLAIAGNLAIAVWMTITNHGPAVPHEANQRLLGFALWGFLVPFVWGFTARWATVLVGVDSGSDRSLLRSFALAVPGAILLALGWHAEGAAILLAASVAVTLSLGVFTRAMRRPVTDGVHPCQSAFVRLAYVWLLAGSALALWGSLAGGLPGVIGASRHALTVGFLSTMVFAVGPRIMPLFTGATRVFSPALVAGSLALLNLGCVLRVVSQVLAYGGHADWAWDVLPVSAVIELTAFTMFAANLGLTFAFRARCGHRAE